MAITINRDQRDAIYQEVALDLAAAVSYLIAQTGAILRTHIVEPIGRTPHAGRALPELDVSVLNTRSSH
jgi:hypothetical protein